MSDLVVHGGYPLKGEIIPSANKNAVLPVLCATLLSKEPITLHNVPDITDVRKILKFFESLGSIVKLDSKDDASSTLYVHHSDDISAKQATLPQGMRSSVMLVPALLHRFGEVRIESDVKGCSLGSREIDPHMELLKGFGADIEKTPEAVIIRKPANFTSSDQWLDYASVTTTENFILCAAVASGESSLTNAASEPHVQEFCDFMHKIGVAIDGKGTSRLHVTGGQCIAGTEFTFVEDFHEVTTFLAISAVTGGDIVVKNTQPKHFPLIDRTFAKFGVQLEHKDGWSKACIPNGLKVQPPFTQYILPKIEAAPWPYFPVDLLPMCVALGVVAEGNMMFWNKVYEGALGWTSELSKFGAHVMQCDPHRIVTYGGKKLTPAHVESPYIIRAAIAMFVIAASIEGKSVIKNADPIKRAHPLFVEKLNALGAKVEWIDS
ncbi:MAG: UDP-N-acetylglucosamine 1-carboxyvinyltransferase [Alphaproteobacteria bacterium]|nr:UDP-N-acetylglucosamine 1-carboxyvinyltransferase [Alphaproteobacteria bacterium]MDD9919942.1 UDP-N-acetylglucosamine 1-carboxyvinyltransferase [Alphaproteobacteria bacterium]